MGTDSLRFMPVKKFFANLGFQTSFKSGGALKKFYTGRLRPSSNPIPFYVSFVDRKGASLVYLTLTNLCPFTDLQSGAKVVDSLV